MSQVPVEATPARPAAKPAKKRSGCGCWLTAAVLLVVVVCALLLVGRSMVETKLEEALAKDVGPAQPWQAALPMVSLPRALVGMPFDLRVTGQQIQVKGSQQIKSLEVDGTGLVADLGERKLRSAERIGIRAVLGEQTVASFVRQEAISSRLFNDLSVQFGVGELLLEGRISAPWLSRFTDYTEAGVVAKAKPEIVPPSSIALRVYDVSLKSGDQAVNIPTTLLSGVMAQDLNFDLNRLLPGLTLQKVDIVDGGLSVEGTLDPQILARGDRPSGPGTPSLPDPRSGTTVQS